MTSNEYSKKLEERDLKDLRELMRKNPDLSLLDLSPLDEDESPALKALSDTAFRLLVNMVLWAHTDRTGITSAGSEHGYRAPYETSEAIEELKAAGLIAQTGNPDTGEYYPHDYAVLTWFEMVGES